MYFLFLLDFILVEILKFFAALSKHFADLLESHHGRFLNTLCPLSKHIVPYYWIR